jgi:hypothetical protein
MNVASSTMNVGSTTLNVGSSTVNVGSSTMNVGSTTLNVGSPTVNVGSSTMNVGSSTMAGVEMPMERASHVAAGEDWGELARPANAAPPKGEGRERRPRPREAAAHGLVRAWRPLAKKIVSPPSRTPS